MNLAALRTLVSIADTGSFSRVATETSTTLSAVSTRMKGLEREIGVPLFDRTTRPPLLLPRGRALAERAREIVAAHDRAVAAAQDADPLSGTLRIGFVGSAYRRHMPRLLAGERGRVRFECRSGLSADLYEDVRARRLDAAVLTRSLDDPAFVQVVVANEPMAIAVPANFAERSLEDVVDALPFIHFMPSTGIGTLIARAAPLPRGPRRTIVLDDITAAVECVAHGIGFTVLPEPDLVSAGGSRVALRRTPRRLTRDLVVVVRAEHGERAERLAQRLRAP